MALYLSMSGVFALLSKYFDLNKSLSDCDRAKQVLWGMVTIEEGKKFPSSL